jgi:hypothetical protein
MLLIRFLLISICVLYILRSLVRLFLPMLFQGIVNRAQQQHNPNSYQASTNKRPEGKVTLDYVPPGKKGTVPDSEGDFVDYEEVK